MPINMKSVKKSLLINPQRINRQIGIWKGAIIKMEEQYKCPWCGCKDVVYGAQADRGKVRPARKIIFNEGQVLIHVICKSCGTVLRSYVQNPEKLVD